MRAWVSLASLVCALAFLHGCGSSAPHRSTMRSYRSDGEAGFIPLLSREALAHWKQCGPGRFVVEKGVATGEGGMGLWWFAGREFDNFILRGEFVQEQEIADS